MTDPLKIVFAGTPEFSVTALQALIASEHHICAVYTQPDRPAGRGRKLTASPIKQLAITHGLTVKQPVSLRNDIAQQELVALKADLMIVVAYGLILPQTVLDTPVLGCWNIHASLLPRWRGAAPIHRAILAGDEKTGVCIMQMDAGLDTGPVLLSKSTNISDDETVNSLHNRLAGLGAEALIEALNHRQQLTPIIQSQSGIMYAHKLEKSESRLDWSETATELDRKIRGFNPWPGAQLNIAGETCKIWRARVETISGTAGNVLKAGGDDLIIACGEGSLRIDELQKPGSRRMPVRDFLNAMPDLRVM